MLSQITKLLCASVLGLTSAIAVVIPGYARASQSMWEQQLTAGFNAHIDFFTAIYLVETRKAVQTPCIIQFADAVQKEIQNPDHNAPFLSERGEQLIQQLEDMWLNADGRFLIAKYRDEGKNLFLNIVFQNITRNTNVE